MYLNISQNDSVVPEVVSLSLMKKLKHLQESQDNQEMTLGLLHVTCNSILQHILLKKHYEPSELLKSSLESNNFLNLVILLLKIVLLFPNSRLYLERYIAELIKFYSSYDETECSSFINFLDVLNVTLAIFEEDTDYSLIKMSNGENDLTAINLENYRIFSQSKILPNLANQSVNQLEVNQPEVNQSVNQPEVNQSKVNQSVNQPEVNQPATTITLKEIKNKDKNQ